MVYFFTKGTISAGSSRHRAFGVEKFLNKHNIKAEVVIPPIFEKEKNKFISRLQYVKKIFSPRKKDSVVLQTTIFNHFFIFLISLSKKIFKFQLIFDFDDAIYINNYQETMKLVKIADKIIVASEKLSEWPKIVDKKKMIMPNLIDAEKTKPFVRNDLLEKEIVLGWIGGAPESKDNLKILVPVFKKIIRQGYKIKFKLIGLLGSQEIKEMFEIPGLNFSFVDFPKWAKENEIEKQLSKISLGLNPLQDNEDNWARCSLKVLNYMSIGIPVVASRIGENNNFIKDGVTGFLCASEDDWVKKIINLLGDRDKLVKMGKAARKRLEKKFSYQGFIQKYINFINE